MLTPLFTMRTYLHARPEDLAGFARGGWLNGRMRDGSPLVTPGPVCVASCGGIAGQEPW
jgi:hypothetical protein